MLNIFITATDTDAGKTYVAQQLVAELVKLNKKVAVYKPIAAGCDMNQHGQLQNEDALLLKTASNAGQSYQAINPIAYEQAIAPHIAASLTGIEINQQTIIDGYQKLTGDINVIEGAGGWRLPLGNGQYLSDIVQQLSPKVILVVNMKLGCLNHAILTYQSIINDGLDCIGWIANNQEDMPFLAENIAELTSLIKAPRLAIVNMNDSLEQAAQQLCAEHC